MVILLVSTFRTVNRSGRKRLKKLVAELSLDKEMLQENEMNASQLFKYSAGFGARRNVLLFYDEKGIYCCSTLCY
ncbi:hypothetical protein DRT92_23120 [Salmonella enterica subsp. enterica serovar Newport]|nr:hypothetical protein [Salmonella enterica subsp. enterica serovar Newport]EBS2390587.1 hypothetical protein [Salmonella enterica subsp. enterica serovar Newport]ECA8783075.1 hypothetical protein [Salmonella enterica subsp. enterica serovar Newport]ECD2007090.1 hypothetical protein [Salmonella enterica subsp. enterica serovar Newport]